MIAAILGMVFLTTVILGLNNGPPVFDNSTRAQTNAIDNSSSKVTNSTFSVSGPIAGLIFSDTSFSTNTLPPDILSGYWQLNVKGGRIVDFVANFSMVDISGYPFHIVRLTNFRTANNTMIQLDVNGSIPRIHGFADIKVDQHNGWNAKSIDLLINRLRTIVILLPPISEQEGGNDLFRAKPITGLIHSFMDKNGEHITTLPTLHIQSFN